VSPVSGQPLSAFQPNSGEVVLPVRMPPASLSRRTKGASWSGTRFAKMYEPDMVRTPLVNARSLMENGMPWIGPSFFFFITACSAARAPFMASSAVMVQKALSLGLSFSTRASTAFMSSTGESFFDRMSGISLVAGM